MLDGGGGGGYAGTTNWYQYDAEAMWRMLENQQTDNHWKHASGWRKTYELTATHMSRLRQYRDGLAEAWPPERSAAARAYIERLDYLISTVKQTYEVASANYTAFTGATSALSSSRRELKEIYDEYVAKKAKKDAQDRRASSGTPTPSPSPSGERPVTQDDLERLNNRARSIMYSLSGELVAAQVQLRQPPPYKAIPGRDGGNPDVYGGGGSAPPVIPPVVPVPTAPPPLTGGGTPPPMQVVPTPTAPGTGPILGGTGTLPPPPPPSPIAPSVITPTPAPPSLLQPGIPSPIPPGPGLLPKTGGLPGPLSTNNGGLPKFGPNGLNGLPKAMPPGGMIGNLPGAGLGQPGATTTPVRRINPVGGVIGGGSSGTVSSTGGVRRVTGVGGHMSAKNGTRDDSRGTVEWDPDNPWATDDGVAPVVLPPRKPGRIDPGPAIGSNQ